MKLYVLWAQPFQGSKLALAHWSVASKIDRFFIGQVVQYNFEAHLSLHGLVLSLATE